MAEALLPLCRADGWQESLERASIFRVTAPQASLAGVFLCPPPNGERFSIGGFFRADTVPGANGAEFVDVAFLDTRSRCRRSRVANSSFRENSASGHRLAAEEIWGGHGETGGSFSRKPRFASSSRSILGGSWSRRGRVSFQREGCARRRAVGVPTRPSSTGAVCKRRGRRPWTCATGRSRHFAPGRGPRTLRSRDEKFPRPERPRNEGSPRAGSFQASRGGFLEEVPQLGRWLGQKVSGCNA